MSRLPAATVAALLGIRLDQGPLEQVLQQLVNIAKDALPGADEVSNTLLRGDRGWTAAYTGQLALDADEMQYERGYGPCMDAGRTGTVLLIDDAREETRWPDYTAHVVERGVLSSLSVPLPIADRRDRRTQLLLPAPSAFPPEAIEIAEELAGHVAVAVANAVAYTDADDAGGRCDSHGQPSGHRPGHGRDHGQNRCDADAAFAILTRALQNRNIKLRDIARGIVDEVSRPVRQS